MPETPKLAGGARPRAESAATSSDAVRVALSPPGGEVASSVRAALSPDRKTVTLSTDVPDVAVGWAVAGRDLSGVVAAVDGRTLRLGTAEAEPARFAKRKPPTPEVPS